MAEPDEALRWARESAYQRALEMLDGDETEALAQIDHEDAEYVINWLADTYRAGAAASAERIKELEARVAELEAALAKADEPEWFYSAEDSAPEHSLEDAIEANLYDSLPGRYLVEIDTARRCKTIWGVVHVLTDEEIEARGDDEPWVFTPCATEAEARALLEQTNP